MIVSDENFHKFSHLPQGGKVFCLVRRDHPVRGTTSCAMPCTTRVMLLAWIHGAKSPKLSKVHFLPFLLPAASAPKKKMAVAPTPPVSNVVVNPTEWTLGVCGCTEDCGTFFYAACCPACAHAEIRSRFDGSDCCFNCCCGGSAAVRSVIRQAYGINGSCIGDCCWTAFCGPCVAVQTKHETKMAHRFLLVKPPGFQRREFVNGICSCEFGGKCFLAFLCPQIVSSLARSEYDGSNCCFNCFCLQPCYVRNVIREGYGIDGGCCGDMCISTLLPWCTAHQMQKEVAASGPIQAYRYTNPIWGGTSLAVASPPGMVQMGVPVQPQQPKAV